MHCCFDDVGINVKFVLAHDTCKQRPPQKHPYVYTLIMLQAKAPLGSVILFMAWATARMSVPGMLAILTVVGFSATWSYWLMARASYALEEDTVGGVFEAGVKRCVERGRRLKGTDKHERCGCACRPSECASRVCSLTAKQRNTFAQKINATVYFFQ